MPKRMRLGVSALVVYAAALAGCAHTQAKDICAVYSQLQRMPRWDPRTTCSGREEQILASLCSISRYRLDVIRAAIASDMADSEDLQDAVARAYLVSKFLFQLPEDRPETYRAAGGEFIGIFVYFAEKPRGEPMAPDMAWPFCHDEIGRLRLREPPGHAEFLACSSAENLLRQFDHYRRTYKPRKFLMTRARSKEGSSTASEGAELIERR